MKNLHLRGLDQDLNQQIQSNKKDGGPSEALRRMAKRPSQGNPNIPLNKVYREDWETKLPKLVAKDAKYIALRAKLDKIRLLNMKDVKKRLELVAQLNDRYDQLKETLCSVL